MASITVDLLYSALQESLHLKQLTKKNKINRKISLSEIHRPGLVLAGYTRHFSYARIQILGQTEISFLKELSRKELEKTLDRFFSFKMPCILVSKDLMPPRLVIQKAEKAHIPIFRSPITTAHLISRVTLFVDAQLAPSKSMHGTLMDVYGVGILIEGKSGVGKSECALELVERGHRLVSDDVVEVRKTAPNVVLGIANETIRHHMEIRGLGIINIQNIFGVGAVRNQKRIRLIVTLEKWNQRKEYERLGLEDKKYKILNVDLPHLVIPVRPGRNIPIIIEAAALQQRERRMGINSAEEFNKKLIQRMSDRKQTVFIEEAD